MIMWALVFILVSGTGQTASYLSSVSSNISDCFEKREELLVEAEWYNGRFPQGSQAVCIRMPVKGLRL